MTDEWRLDTLPSDVLLLIFDYCHAFDLVRIAEVCTRFNDIVRDEALWYERSKRLVATNQASERFRERCHTLLDPRTRWHVSENWQCGKFERKFFHSWKEKAMPWIRLSRDVIWWSGGNRLCGFLRKRGRNSRSGEATGKADKIFERNNVSADITKFVVREEWIIGGHSDGAITFWARSSPRDVRSDFRMDDAHSSNVHAIDEVPGAIISGSADGTVKLWAQPRERERNVPRATIRVLDRIWSLAADVNGTKFAVGSSGHNGVPPLKIFDIECTAESDPIGHPWRRGAGILDMVWENSNILLTCGYDTCIRKWDTRTGSCVASWTDPTDAALYCISSDYHRTMITGTQYNCKAVLWDQRMTNYMQLYFLSSNGRISSPVYSISFDSSNLYGATDRNLVELTYSGYGYRQTDYRDVFGSECSMVQNSIS